MRRDVPSFYCRPAGERTNRATFRTHTISKACVNILTGHVGFVNITADHRCLWQVITSRGERINKRMRACVYVCVLSNASLIDYTWLRNEHVQTSGRNFSDVYYRPVIKSIIFQSWTRNDFFYDRTVPTINAASRWRWFFFIFYIFRSNHDWYENFQSFISFNQEIVQRRNWRRCKTSLQATDDERTTNLFFLLVLLLTLILFVLV